MKVALYFEFHQFLNGIFFKRRATGLLSSFRNQKEYLTKAGIDWVEGLDPTADIIQFNAPWLRTRWAMRQAKKRGQKTILFAHTTVEDSIGVFWFTKFITEPYRWYLKNTFRKPDLLVCPSHYTKDLLVTRYGIPAEKCRVVSNGVDARRYKRNPVSRARVRRELKADKKLIFGCVAILVERKGVYTFIKLAKERPQHLFVWVGRPMAQSFLKKVRRLASPNCIFLGYVDDVRDYLSAYDAFVFPSFEENQGIALLEAASADLPLLIRDLPVYKDWLHHKENCLVATTPEQFLENIDFVAANQERAQKLAKASHILAQKNDLQLMGDYMKKVYLDLTKNKIS